jgi:hypothetical protein
MGITTTRSPWSLERGDFHAQRGISPGAHSSPSNARSDGGHLAGHVGKSASQPASARRDSTPVAGGESAAPLEQALDRGMRGDRR